MTETHTTARIFKTAWFAKAAKKARIRDEELCTALRQVMQGQADDTAAACSKNVLTTINTVQSSLPKAVNTGFIPICLLKKTEAI
jgi:hypothetical protein